MHAFAPDTAVSDIAGDLLYALLIYALVVVLVPRLPALGAGAIMLVWCVGVEAFQLTGLPVAWAAAFPPIVLVLGTVFDARDLAVYAVAAVGAACVDAFACGRSTPRRGRTP